MPPQRNTTVVRRAEPRDAPILAELRFAFRSVAGIPNEPKATFLDRCATWMAARLAETAAWQAWVAEDKEGVCGQVWIQTIEKVPNPVDESEVHGYLTNLYVDPRARGRGIGSALVETALARCREKRMHAVILWSTPESRSVYERHGFQSSSGVLQLVVHPTEGPAAVQAS